MGDFENIFKYRNLYQERETHIDKEKDFRWSRDLDIDTLNERNCWATLSELNKVAPFHSDRYDNILKRAKDW